MPHKTSSIFIGLWLLVAVEAFGGKSPEALLEIVRGSCVLSQFPSSHEKLQFFFEQNPLSNKSLKRMSKALTSKRPEKFIREVSFEDFERNFPDELAGRLTWILENPYVFNGFIQGFYRKYILNAPSRVWYDSPDTYLTKALSDSNPFFLKRHPIQKFVIKTTLRRIFDQLNPKKITQFKAGKLNFTHVFFQYLKESIFFYVYAMNSLYDEFHEEASKPPGDDGTEQPVAIGNKTIAKAYVDNHVLQTSKERWVSDYFAQAGVELLAFDRGVLLLFAIPGHVRNADFIFYDSKAKSIIIAEEKLTFSDQLIAKALEQMVQTAEILDARGLKAPLDFHIFFQNAKQKSSLFSLRDGRLTTLDGETKTLLGKPIYVHFQDQ